MTLARPDLLWLLPLFLIPVLAWTWSSRAGMTPLRNRWAGGIRLLLVVLCVFALSRPSLVFEVTERATLCLLDVSDSLGPDGKARARKVAKTILDVASRSERVAVVGFAGSGIVMVPPSESPGELPTLAPDALKRDETDIGGAIDLALGVLPGKSERRLVLVTDGNETRGKALEAARRATEAGVPIDVVPISGGGGTDAMIREIVLSDDQLARGGTLEGQVIVSGMKQTKGIVRLFENNIKIQEWTVEIEPGEKKALRFERVLEDQGLYSYRAIAEFKPDDRRENNVGLAFCEVRGQASVLLIDRKENETRFLHTALLQEGIACEVRPPEGIPRTLSDLEQFDLLILSDLSSIAMTDAQMELIRTYVRDLGGGFCMIGGEHSFGLGGYRGTPIADILPVTMDEPDKAERGNSAVVLVVDKSGSMGSGSGGATKIGLVKEAGASVVGVLGRKDFLGVVAFDSQATWVQDLERLDNPENVVQTIGTLAAGGGTNMYPAMLEAYNALSKVKARVKHAILLSDGQTQGAGYQGLAEQMRDEGMTISTVAVGDGAQVNLMKTIAETGEGVFYYVRDIQSIPRIFTQDTMRHATKILQEEPFRPVVQDDSQSIRGIDFESSPYLFGYVATRPKSTATVPLVTHRRDPLLAHWQVGVGRAVAYSSDVKNRWARLWIERWPGFRKLWAQIIRVAMRRSPGGMELRTKSEGDSVQVTCDLFDDNGRFDSSRSVEAEVLFVGANRGGRPRPVGRLDLDSIAPGRFRGRLPIQDPGAYILRVTAGETTRTLGFVQPYKREYRDRVPDEKLLRALALATGGRYSPSDPTPAGLPVPAARRTVPIGSWLLFVACILLILNVGFRRLNRIPKLFTARI